MIGAKSHYPGTTGHILPWDPSIATCQPNRSCTFLLLHPCSDLPFFLYVLCVFPLIALNVLRWCYLNHKALSQTTLLSMVTAYCWYWMMSLGISCFFAALNPSLITYLIHFLLSIVCAGSATFPDKAMVMCFVRPLFTSFCVSTTSVGFGHNPFWYLFLNRRPFRYRLGSGCKIGRRSPGT